MEGLELHAFVQRRGGLLELARLVKFARLIQGILHPLVNFFIQALESVGDFFHFDERLGLGILGARLRQLPELLQLLGFSGHGLDLSFQFLFLGLFQIVGVAARNPSTRAEESFQFA